MAVTLAVEQFELGTVELELGGTLEDARLAYATAGTLAPDRGNVVVVPSYYTGSHADSAHMLGAGRALDPAQHFIILPNLFGNAVSSSPSNSSAARFPLVTVADNVRFQRRLLRERWGIEQVALVAGWSMGASSALSGRPANRPRCRRSRRCADQRELRRTTRSFSMA